MICSSCGKIINDDSEFCAYCGKPVKSVQHEVDAGDDTPQEADSNSIESEDTEAKAAKAAEAAKAAFSQGKGHDSLRTGDMRMRHRHRKSISGLTKGALVLFVGWTAIIGVILVRHNLRVQDAREAARAANAATGVTNSKSAPSSSQGASEALSSAGSASATTKEAGAEDTEQEDFTFKCIFKNATGWEQINHVAAYLAPGKDVPTNDPAYQLELTADGYAVSRAQSGDYTLTWQADGYYVGYENITIGQTMLSMEKNLIPVLTDPKNCMIMLEWKGDRDLDLCLFDAHNQKLINILYPTDGANFLYEDNGENRRCEVIRIADCTQPQVYTVYVRDDALLRNIVSDNKISMMERDGVKITIATTAGIIAVKTADPNNTSALWSPLYVYESNVYPVDNYTTNYEEEAWAFYDKTVR